MFYFKEADGCTPNLCDDGQRCVTAMFNNYVCMEIGKLYWISFDLIGTPTRQVCFYFPLKRNIRFSLVNHIFNIKKGSLNDCQWHGIKRSEGELIKIKRTDFVQAHCFFCFFSKKCFTVTLIIHPLLDLICICIAS